MKKDNLFFSFARSIVTPMIFLLHATLLLAAVAAGLRHVILWQSELELLMLLRLKKKNGATAMGTHAVHSLTRLHSPIFSLRVSHGISLVTLGSL